MDERKELAIKICNATQKTNFNCNEIKCGKQGECAYCLVMAEELLKNGVIVPPCNIGDTAYCITYSKNGYKNIAEHRVVGFHIINAPPKRAFKRENYLIFFHEQTNLTSHSPFKKIGETVFFTREAAEQAVKERESNA